MLPKALNSCLSPDSMERNNNLAKVDLKIQL